MQYINETLAKVGCGITDLPNAIQSRIETLKGLDAKIVEAQKEVEAEPNAENQENLEDVTDFRNNFEYETCDMIEEWHEDSLEEKKKEEAEKVKTDAEKKAKEEAEKNQNPPTPPIPPTPPTPDPKPEKKKGIGLGGIILGVAVLAITMGAVNTMKNK